MDWDYVGKIAVFTVGVTQLIKKFVQTKSNRIKVLITVLSGAAGGLLLYYLPPQVFLTVVGISVGVLFYDGILKAVEKRISELGIASKKEDI